MKTVDVCGLSCPEPLLQLKRIIDKESEILLRCDSPIAADTCTDFAKSKGFNVTRIQTDNTIELKFKK